jgi:hypothetical protein
MKLYRTTRLTLGALFAATALGGAGIAAAQDAPEPGLAVTDVLQPAPDENGARAAPSVSVDEAVLPERALAMSGQTAAHARLALAANTGALAQMAAVVSAPGQLAPSPAAAAPSPVLASAETAADAAPRAAAPEETGIRQHVAFPRRSAEAAAAFDSYMHTAANIGPGFQNGMAVAGALQTGATYDPSQIEEGMIAYGAMAALQEPQFVYALMDAAANDRNRLDLADQILANPSVVMGLHGAQAAAARAAAAIDQEADPVVAAGKALKQASYDVQHQDWSKVFAPDAAQRLARAKAASSVRAAARDEDMARLLVQVSTMKVATNGRQGASAVAMRSLALAALALLDGTEGEDPARLDPVVSEPISAECLKMAKLNLFQCLSAAGPEYEDVYCLGQHAVLDTGQCVADAAGKSAPATLMSAMHEDRSRIMIPVAALSAMPASAALGGR